MSPCLMSERMKSCYSPQALSINPRSLLASLESIVECGVTLTEPLRSSDGGDHSDQARLTPGDKHPGLNTRSNSRLALAAKTIGESRIEIKH